jgi:hypothetical protein
LSIKIQSTLRPCICISRYLFDGHNSSKFRSVSCSRCLTRNECKTDCCIESSVIIIE